MSKKNSSLKDNISSLGLGVLDIIEKKEPETVVTQEINESISVNNEKSNSSNDEKNNEVIEQKSKSVKGEKEAKSKRSFMLKENTIHKLSLLKLCMNDKDLSTIVEESIDMYFEKNKESIESLIDIYNKVK